MVRGSRKGKKGFEGKLSHGPTLVEYFPVEGSPAPPRKKEREGGVGGGVLKVADGNAVTDGGPGAASPQHRIQMKPPAPAKQGKVTDFFPVRRSVRKTKKAVLEEARQGLEEAVEANREEGLEVRNFPGKGRGVVATTTFDRGDFVVEYAGELISVEEARCREAEYSRDENTGCYMYYFQYGGTSWCVDATRESPRLGRLVNHSRAGNLMTKAVVVGGRPRLVLIAKSTIRPGQEVTYDYGDRSKDSLRHHPWLAL